VLDFETGGLLPTQRTPVTLGLAIFEGGEVVKSKEWAFKPLRDSKGKRKYDYSECASEIHGKSLAWLEENGLGWRRIYNEVTDFLGCGIFGVWDDLIISHNAPFDCEIWSTFIFHLGAYCDTDFVWKPKRELLAGPWQDTKRIAQSEELLLGEDPSLKLTVLAKKYGIGEQGDIHGAEADAILAGKLYLALRGL
jgi:DNA polymerase III epsilon subunit-like protein